MTLKKYNAEFKNNRFVIEEDLPGVGWYLYVFDKSGNCIADYLQNDFESSIEFANEEFAVPNDKWNEIE